MSKGRRPKVTAPQTASDNPELYLTPSQVPAELRGELARLQWRTLLEDLAAENRRLPASQKMIVLGYCSAAQLLADSEDSIMNDGILIEGGREGRRRNPALSSKIQALGLVRSYAAEIGLSPASASRLPLPAIEEEFNPFSEL